MKKFIKIIIILMFLLFLIFLYFNKQNLPLLLFQIKSGSMMPEISVGEIVVLIKQKEYKQQDIITYQVNNSYFITHRIIEIEKSGYITKGDANNTEDREKVKNEQIKGKVIFHSKVLGKIFKYRYFILFIIVFFLILL